ISSTGDEHEIDRWEYYEGGGLARAEEDTDGNGKVDRWETYENGALKTAAMDENGDGMPDRRLTYSGGGLVLIESAPDPWGRFTKRVDGREARPTAREGSPVALAPASSIAARSQLICGRVQSHSLT